MLRCPAGDNTANLDVLYQNIVRSDTPPASVGLQPFGVPASAQLRPVPAGSRPLPKGATTMHATHPHNGHATNGDMPIPLARFTLPLPSGANGVVPHAARPPSPNGDCGEKTAGPPSPN